MTINEWAKDFRSFVNELQMSRDDYKGIMEYIDDAVVLLKEQEELLRKLQKDKDKLCCEISEWKHKYHDTLKEQDAEVEWCERCGRVRLKSKQECR